MLAIPLNKYVKHVQTPSSPEGVVGRLILGYKTVKLLLSDHILGTTISLFHTTIEITVSLNLQGMHGILLVTSVAIETKVPTKSRTMM